MGRTHWLAALGVALAVGAANPTPASEGDAALGRGAFLVATRQVTGYFAETVLLLLDYDPRGAFGVIINRPSTTPVTRFIPEEQEPPDRTDRIYRGGPVGTDSLAVLIRSKNPRERTTHIISDLHAGFGARVLRRAIEDGVPVSRIRAYLGHAGWAPGQLDNEVARGDWRVVKSTPDIVFDDDPEKIWPRLIFEHGGLQVRLGR